MRLRIVRSGLRIPAAWTKWYVLCHNVQTRSGDRSTHPVPNLILFTDATGLLLYTFMAWKWGIYIYIYIYMLHILQIKELLFRPHFVFMCFSILTTCTEYFAKCHYPIAFILCSLWGRNLSFVFSLNVVSLKGLLTYLPKKFVDLLIMLSTIDVVSNIEL